MSGLLYPNKDMMKATGKDYAASGLWSHTDLAYIRHDPALMPFIAFPPVRNSFHDLIQSRRRFPIDRNLLWSALSKQYKALGLEVPVTEEVLLSPDTFTVTTAHQPVLLTGPLYHIYKIASTIHLSQTLSKPEYSIRCLPVFIIGGEDHDWAEVNHLHLFGRQYQWERPASGSCGRLSLEGLDALVASVKELFNSSNFAVQVHQLLDDALAKASTYAQFHHLLLHGLFGAHGLIILNMDDASLKRAFVPWMERELQEQFSYQYVTPTQGELEKAGFKPQAYCRPVNLFYMSEGSRERLEPNADGYLRVDSQIQYSKEAILKELNEAPERFSPNVIMRPLYQECILPNLAYIGGGGELAYWIERKSQFEAAGIHYPMLIRRNSLLLIDDSTTAQMEKAGLTLDDLLLDIDTLTKTYLIRNSHTDTDYQTELGWVKSAYAQLAEKAKPLDPTLATAIEAEGARQLKQFEQLGSRLLRAEKQLQETNLRKVQKIKEKLFPENSLQERHDNFLPFYARYGPQWIKDMIEVCDPLTEQFTLVELGTP